MKLYIQYEKGNQSGKGKFLDRLIPELEELGVTCQYEKEGADIALGLTRWREKTKMPKVLRVDGIHLINDKKHLWNNNRIRKSIKKADAVIYQSEWGRFMIESIFNFKNVCSYVIHNGAHPRKYELPIASPYPKNVIMSAKWAARDDRRQKRLKDMVEISYEYIKRHSDVCFWIAGRNELPVIREERIVNLDYLEDSVLRRYLAMADVMLNLAWWDWCPNAVVEAICARCVVVGSDKSGVGELINLCGGVGVNIDKTIPPRVKYPDNYPPSFDHSKVIAGLDKAFTGNVFVDFSPVDIRNVAREYKTVFEAVLNE